MVKKVLGCWYECMYYGIPMLTEYVPGSGLNEIIPKQFILNNRHINDYLSLTVLGKK